MLLRRNRFFDSGSLVIFRALFVTLLLSTIAIYTFAQSGIEDREIESTINVRLQEREDVASHLINVSVEKGIVRLSGSVDNLMMKKQATRIAEGVEGVLLVNNDIAVHPLRRPDSEIKQDVRIALLNEAAINEGLIKVKVKRANVLLKGKVSSGEERILAIAKAAGVNGVRSVKSDLTLLPMLERTDKMIKEDILASLLLSPNVNEQNIFVEVEDQKVTLFGTVDNMAERRAVIEDAWTAGVKDVDVSKLKYTFSN